VELGDGIVLAVAATAVKRIGGRLPDVGAAELARIVHEGDAGVDEAVDRSIRSASEWRRRAAAQRVTSLRADRATHASSAGPAGVEATDKARAEQVRTVGNVDALLYDRLVGNSKHGRLDGRRCGDWLGQTTCCATNAARRLDVPSRRRSCARAGTHRIGRSALSAAAGTAPVSAAAIHPERRGTFCPFHRFCGISEDRLAGSG
jgi:hypothetical protein